MFQPVASRYSGSLTSGIVDFKHALAEIFFIASFHDRLVSNKEK
jgi:hypothetical protein